MHDEARMILVSLKTVCGMLVTLFVLRLQLIPIALNPQNLERAVPLRLLLQHPVQRLSENTWML